MADLIVGGIFLVIVGAAIRYIYKEKKNGSPCIGCPNGGSCGGKNGRSSCSCGGHSDK